MKTSYYTTDHDRTTKFPLINTPLIKLCVSFIDWASKLYVGAVCIVNRVTTKLLNVFIFGSPHPTL